MEKGERNGKKKTISAFFSPGLLGFFHDGTFFQIVSSVFFGEMCLAPI